MYCQRTLKHTVRTTGVGLHSGEKVDLVLRPAPINHGIVFTRTDLNPPIAIPASALNVRDTRLSSGIEVPEAKLSTVEHLMAALAGLGIDNALIDVSGPEVPIMDGSSAPFVFLLQQAGIETQTAPKRYIRIKDTISVTQGDKSASLSPHAGFRMDFTIDFPHPSLDDVNQRVVIDFSEQGFAADVARARTFCFTKDVEFMRANGLALGGNLSNAIVLDDYKILNAEGLRFGNELALHKLLDALGDLYLLGMPLIGSYTAVKSGHALNNLLARELLNQPERYEVVTFAPAAANEPVETLQAFRAWA
jgi:UDP-3-O-[3-hydroxymyristoyl] N-acetylglucosamine deacetylase